MKTPFFVWLCSLSMIGVGWFIYDHSPDKSWGRVAVGAVNELNGMAAAWCIITWAELRKKPK